MHNTNQNVLFSTVSLIILATVSATAAPSTALEEILVTTQKRSENIQDVPIAISAFNADSLRQSGLENTYDLQLKTPGLVMTTNGAFGQPYIRGIGTDILGAATDNSIAVNVDGIYIARPTAAIQDFYDVARVELVKGPQGTLYGRNATGGAINIVNNAPEDTFSASMDATFGNYDKVRVTGHVNVPLSETTAVRASFITSSRDGFTKLIDAAGGDAVKGSLDGDDRYGGRVQLLTRPNDNLSIQLSVDYQEQDDTRGLNNRPNPDFADITPALSLGGVVPDDVRLSTQDAGSINNIEDWGMGTAITYDFDGVTLKSLSAFRQNKYFAIQDIDGTNLNVGWQTEGQNSKVFTQEFQLSSESERLKWLVGVYYLHEKASSFFNVRLGGDVSDLFGLGLENPWDNLSVAVADANNKTNAYAAFGQASYFLTDELSITVGLRYSYEKKNFTLLDAVNAIDVADHDSWSSLTPKFGIEYRVTDDAMLYASVTRGFKSGGFNANGIGEKFDEEDIWSYEMGLKADWLDGRVRTNLAAFYYDYKDLQVRVRDPNLGTQAVVANAGQADVYGLEGDITALITDEFAINLNAAYLSTDIADNTFIYNVRENAEVNVGGNRLPRAPKFSFAAQASYTVPVPTGDVEFTAEYRYVSGVFFDVFNWDLAREDDYSLVNARITYTNAEHNWYVAIWGKNLTDTTYKASALYNGLAGSLEFFAPPRTYGVQAGVKF
jgi:iron complex outermembrane receptor protein